ncbi:hypothetical protein JTB14_032634 [Gonioctena quinquepunctata]|nr:hypothetical protein JTB14_032634 [Gonioctena quinquepunctata]
MPNLIYTPQYLSIPIFVPNGSQFSSPGSEVERIEKYSSCGSILNLLECNTLETRSFSRRNVNIIGSKYKPGDKCYIKKVSFDWNLSFENGTMCNYFYYQDRDIFVIKPLSLGMGKYRIVLNVVEYNINGMRNMLSDECMFTIIKEQPIRAADVKIPKDEDFFSIEGRGLINPTVPPNRNESFTNGWNWDETGKTRSDIHKRSLKNHVFSIPPKEKTIHLEDLTIICKNCDGVDVTKQVILAVECSKQCGKMKPTNYTWYISFPGFDYERDTVSGRGSEEFVIKPNVLHRGAVYIFTVKVYIGDFLSPVLHLTTSQKIGNYSCEINPKSGLALETVFRVNCTFQEVVPNFYELKDERDFLLAGGPNLEELPFLLDGNKVVKVNFCDEDHVCYRSHNLSVTVSRCKSMSIKKTRH